MSKLQRLRVIGARSILRFFLPREGRLFSSCEFFLTKPGEAGLLFRNLPDDDSLTIVVNPDDYKGEELTSLPGNVWFWFLKPIYRERSNYPPETPASLFTATDARRSFLESLEANSRGMFVVSDSESFLYMDERGMRARLSPPPVTDTVADFVPASGASICVWAQEKASKYVSKFLEALPASVAANEFHLDANFPFTKTPTHMVVLQQDFVRAFPYEAAMTLVAGRTLISEALVPRWGLESGLDYLEYSTPEELRRIVEHLARYPNSTHLMSWRGRLKSQTFKASQVYSRLLFSLGE